MRTQVLVTITVALILGPRGSSSAVLDVPSEYSTINEAIQAADVGDTVLVAPDTYYETVELKAGVTLLSSAGRSETSILILDQDPVLVFLEPPEELSSGETICSGFYLDRLDDFGYPPVMSWNPNGVVDDCMVLSGGSGDNHTPHIYMWNGGIVRNSYVENPSQSSMFFTGAAGSQLVVEDCEITGIFADGLYFAEDSHIVFRNNSITSETYIKLIEGAETNFIVEFVNNIFFDGSLAAHGSGVFPDSVSVRYNCYWDVSMYGSSPEFFENDPTNFEADPLFCGAVLTPQWHWLDQASPCFGAGENGEDVGARIGICGVTNVPDTDGRSSPSSANTFRVWPNPTSDGIRAYYSGSAGSETEAWVLDASGRRIATADSRFTTEGLGFLWNGKLGSGRDAPAGSYFLQLRNGEKPAGVRKFLIVR